MNDINIPGFKKSPVKINLKKEAPPAVRPAAPEGLRPPKKPLKLIVFGIIFLITALAVFSSQVLVSNQSSTSWIARLPFVSQIRHLAESVERQLKGEDEDRINILLLGMAGRNHEGGLLTDTIMLLSLEPSTKKVAMTSIPRDMAVPIEDMGWRKINHVNAYAEVAESGGGGVAVSQALSDILAVPVHYYVRADFTGFVNIIDLLGGIEVNVENRLEDYSYPVMGREAAEPYESRFEHLLVEPGLQNMDGELALKYARSRKALGAEGSDFARARRQQKILEAAKNKAFTVSTLFKPKMISDIVDEFQEHVATNLKIWEMIKLWDMFKGITSENITNKVLDNSPNNLLYDTISSEGAYILLPRSGDFAEIQYFINNIFSDAPAALKNVVKEERAAIEVRNGTWINGLASQAAIDLERYGFTVIRVGNSSRQNFQKSVIFDLTYGEKNQSLAVLKEKTGANVSLGLPQWLIDEIKNELKRETSPLQPDFVIVLGQDADKTRSGLDNQEDDNN